MAEGYGDLFAGYGMRARGYEVCTAKVFVEIWELDREIGLRIGQEVLERVPVPHIPTKAGLI